MNEVRKEINNKYNVHLRNELTRLETQMESNIVKYLSAFGKVQLKIAQQ